MVCPRIPTENQQTDCVKIQDEIMKVIWQEPKLASTLENRKFQES